MKRPNDNEKVIIQLPFPGFYHAWSDAMDWAKWDEKVKEKAA